MPQQSTPQYPPAPPPIPQDPNAGVKMPSREYLEQLQLASMLQQPAASTFAQAGVSALGYYMFLHAYVFRGCVLLDMLDGQVYMYICICVNVACM